VVRARAPRQGLGLRASREVGVASGCGGLVGEGPDAEAANAAWRRSALERGYGVMSRL
jgi:hypothetical protein